MNQTVGIFPVQSTPSGAAARRALAARIRATRRSLALTQRQLAHLLHTTPNTIARWESGAVAPANPGLVLAALAQLTAKERTA